MLLYLDVVASSLSSVRSGSNGHCWRRQQNLSKVAVVAVAEALFVGGYTDGFFGGGDF